MKDILRIENKEFVSAQYAASLFGFTRDYVNRLCREGRVSGRRVGTGWFVEYESMKRFVVHAELERKHRNESLARERKKALLQKEVVPSEKPLLKKLSTLLPTVEPTWLDKHLVRAVTLASQPESLRQAAAYSVVHIPQVTPIADVLHKFFALVIAFMLTFGTYGFVDAHYRAYTMDSLRHLAHAVTTAPAQVVAFVANPHDATNRISAAVIEMGESNTASVVTAVEGVWMNFAHSVRTHTDAYIARRVYTGTPLSLGASPRVSVSLVPVEPKVGLLETSTHTTIVQPVVERVVYTAGVPMQAPATLPSVAQSTLAELTEKLFADIDTVVSQRIAQSTPSIQNSYAGGGTPTYAHTYGLTQRIDTLSGVAISGGTISGAAISGGSLSGVSVPVSDITGVMAVSQGGTGTSTAPVYGQLLIGDGAGGYQLTATSSLGISGGSGVPGGADGQVQFNNSGVLGGSALYYSTTTGFFGIGTSSPYAQFSVVGETVAERFTATSTTATSTFTNTAIANLILSGVLYDNTNNAGASGYVLQSTGGGVQWVATSSLGIAGGSGAVFGQAFEISNGYLAPTTTQTILASGGLMSQASSTFSGGVSIDRATTTAATSTTFFSESLVTTHATSSTFFSTLARFATGIADTLTATVASITNLTATSAVFTNATSTNATTTSLGIAGVTNALLSTNAQGTVVATSSISANYLDGALVTTSEIDTEGELETVLTDVSNVFTNNDTITDTNIADDITLTNITQITNRAITDTTGTLTIARGGTGTTTAPQGQLLYGGATAYQSVATSSLSAGAGVTFTGTPGALVGGSDLVLSLNTTGDWTGTFDGQEGAYYLNASNLTNFGTPFYQLFSATTTDALTEGSTNKYYTTLRFAADLAGTTTTALAEGTNLYFTNARARSALSSSATGLSYNNTTGDFSLTSGYTIPLTASTTEWNTWYTTPSSRITAGTGLSWSGNTLNAQVQSSDLASYLTLASWYATTTDALDEGATNLYFTSLRATENFVSNLAATTSVASITALPNLSTVGTITSGTWQGTALTDTYVADALTLSGGTIGSNSISGTLTTTGALTIGDNGDTITIDSSNWDVSSTGIFTGGTWQGTAINPTYLDSSVILSTEIDTSSELATLVTDETGSGALVFGTTPTITDGRLASTTLSTNTLITGNATSSGTFALTTLTSSLVKTNSIGQFVAAVAGTDYLTTAITALGPLGQTQTGSTITIATSTGSFNGLTAGVTITGAGNTLTYTPSLTGTLNNAGLTNSTVSYGGITLSLGGTDATPAFNLVDATGLPIATGVSGLGTGVATFLGTPSSANLAAAVTGETGSGALVFGTTPTITDGRLASTTLSTNTLITGNATSSGTFALTTLTSSLVKTNSVGQFVAAVAGTDYLTTAITALGPLGQTQTGSTITIATSTGSFNGLTAGVTITGAGNTLTYTPSLTGTLNNAGLTNSTVSYGGITLSLGGTDATPAFNLVDATGLPISTGVSGLGTGVATFLGTPSSANLAASVTGETGSGALVFGTSPTVTTLTVSSGGASITGGINNNTGGITNAGAVSGVTTFTATSATTTNLAVTGITNAILATNAQGTVIATTTLSGISLALTNGYVFRGSALNTTEATSTLYIANSGNVGIGTTSPYARTSIWGGATGDILNVVTNASSTALTVTATGVVGIGTATPEAVKLDIAGGDVLVDNNMFYQGETSTGDNVDLIGITNSNNITIGSTALTAGGNIQTYLASGGSFGVIASDSTTFRMYVAETGNVAIGNDPGPDAALEIVDNGADILNISSSASGDGDYLTIDSSGNVGIGLTPTEKLHVAGNIRLQGGSRFLGSDGTTFTYDGDTIPHYGFTWYSDSEYPGGSTFGASGYGAIKLFSGGTPRVTVSTNGNVGIGTTSPQSNLHVGSSGATIRLNTSAPAAGVYGYNDTSNIQSFSMTRQSINGGVDMFLSAYTGFGIQTGAAGTLSTTNPALYINSSGSVGIGTTTPQAKLHVEGTNVLFNNTVGSTFTVRSSVANGNDYEMVFEKARGGATPSVITSADDIGSIRFKGYDGTNYVEGAGILADTSGTIGTGSIGGTLNFTTNGSSRIFIDADGDVGIGDTTPASLLTVGTGGLFQVNSSGAIAASTGITTTGQVTLSGSAANIALGSNYLSGDGGDEGIYVDSTGNVGIGTTTPSSVLPSGFSLGKVLQVQSASTAVDAGLLLRRSDGVTGVDIWIDSNGSAWPTYFDNRYSGSDFVFRTNGAGTPAERMRILSGGNVGIGDASPAAMLTVGNGDLFQVNSSGAIAASTGITTTGQVTLSGSAANIALGSNYLSGDGGDEGIYVDATGNVGIGTTTPSSRLHVYNAAAATTISGRTINLGVLATPLSGRSGFTVWSNANSYLSADHNAAFGFVHPWDSADATGSYKVFRITTGTESGASNTVASALTDRFYVQKDGGAYFQNAVGIGTTTPFGLLSVNPNGIGTAPAFVVGSSTKTLFKVDNDGTTSIGDSAATGDANFQFAADANAWSLGYNSSDKSFRIASSTNFSSNVALTITKGSANKVGIGTTTPSDTLDVYGDVRVGTGTTGCVKDADGTVLAGTCSSDENLKTNITTLSSVFNTMRDLSVVTFNWNETASSEYNYGTQATQTGVIAQQIEALFPELIATDSKGYKQVDYTTLNLYALKALSEVSGALSIGVDGKIGIGTTTPEYKLHVVGDVAAAAFVNTSTGALKTNVTHLSAADEDRILSLIASTTPATYSYTFDEPTAAAGRFGLIAEEAPQEVLSADGKGVDIYKLATFTLAGVKAQQRQLQDIEMRLVDIETALAEFSQEEHGMVSFVLAALKQLGVEITDSLTKVSSLAAAAVTVGSSEKPSGITLYDEETGEAFCVKIRGGEMVHLPGECGAQTEAPAPIEIIVQGNNPTTLTVGQAYVDLGAVASSSDQALLNFGVRTYQQMASTTATSTLDWVEVVSVTIDTTLPSEHTVLYRVVDGEGVVRAEALRTITVVGNNAPPPTGDVPEEPSTPPEETPVEETPPLPESAPEETLTPEGAPEDTQDAPLPTDTGTTTNPVGDQPTE